MSLIKSLGEAALKRNISTEVKSGKPVSNQKKVKPGKVKGKTKKVNKKFKLP